MIEFLAKNPDHAPPVEIFNGRRGRHAEVPRRLDVIEQALLRLESSKVIYPPSFQSLPDQLLSRIHDHSYLNFLASTQETETSAYRYPSVFPYRKSEPTKQPNGELGFYSIDMYTPVNQTTYASAKLSAEAAYNAALAVLNGEKSAYAIGRPPGHHAGYDYMGGYCYLNNAAVASKTLADHGQTRVGILDVDYHHGNGTEDIFRQVLKYPWFVNISIHADPNRKFPYFSGRHLIDEGYGLGINFPLEEGVNDGRYDEVLNKSLKILSDQKVSHLVVPVGFDTHEEDPLGDFRLTTAYYKLMAKNIMALSIPTVFIQEGGYNLRTIGKNIASFISGVEDN